MVRTITTDNGFSCKVDDEILNDYEFVELYSHVRNNGSYLPDFVNFFFGNAEQVNQAKDFLRNNYGRATVADMAALVTEIITKLGGKNLSSSLKCSVQMRIH